MAHEDPKPSRRDFIAKASAVALASTLPARAQAPAVQSRKRPLNVLFFMSDDMRPELACYGSRFNSKSPNIDKLAAQGVRFDRNFCQFPLCNPSRSSLFSGRPPHATRVLGNSDGVRNLHPDWITLPHLFRQAGYTTLRTGKLFHAGLDDPAAWTDFDGDVESMHPTNNGTRLDFPPARIPLPDGTVPPLPRGNEKSEHSDEILILAGQGEGSGDAMVADRAIQYLNQARDKPFFIGCGFSKPHSPPQAPQRFFDMYDPAKLQLPPDFAACLQCRRAFPRLRFARRMPTCSSAAAHRPWSRSK